MPQRTGLSPAYRGAAKVASYALAVVALVLPRRLLEMPYWAQLLSVLLATGAVTWIRSRVERAPGAGG
ncbi:hypothetical protein ACIQWR_16360 [Streptomyces sp. NPDC098789]|uniref:hypothetical protein n=1 Tax=Streptomyces sp. NPDC098789 TaxID=3366098 RepID=UPI003806CB71